ncbi:unnamed protein product [Callosobruchus maculatus]|uniref:Gustatory receptor n=1 Tax=Callosobruchus maculatus TaxID=64391 RepID=A0A653DLG6_CALMS|nr:unnamed protein product [Callosobruchus maculatus]
MLFFPAVLNITGFWYLYDKRKDLTVEDISSVIFIYPTCLINMIMMVVIYVHIDMIHFIQSEMQAERFQPKTSAQLADAKKWKRTARLFQKVLFINNSFCVPTIAVLRLLKGEKLLLAAHVFPGVNWKTFYIYQVVTCAASCMTCSTYVTLVTSLLIEIIIQLCLLERSLQAMEDDMDLKYCVQWHLDILVFVKKVQRFCGVGVSAVFICGIFNICTSLALTLTAEVSDLPFFLLYLGAMVSIIYSHCWCGSEVTHQRQDIQCNIQLEMDQC